MTYQVLGHLKTVLVLGFGFFVLVNPISSRNIFGILVALVGMVAYGAAEMNEKKKGVLQNGSSGSSGDLKGVVLPSTRSDVNG